MECDTLRCAPQHYCHEATNSCRPCAAICNANDPGYEPGTCFEKCRDFAAAAGSVDGTARVLGAVGLGLGLLSLLLFLLCAALLLFCVFRRARKVRDFLQARIDADLIPEMKVKMSTNNNHYKHGGSADLVREHSVCTVSGSLSEAELRTHALAGPQQPPPPAGVQQPLSLSLPLHNGGALGPLGLSAAPAAPFPPARHPSEDSTLDYAAYDNPALSPSSSPLPPAAADPKAVDAVLDAVLDPASSLPGTVVPTRVHNNSSHHHHHRYSQHINNGATVIANGSVARVESSF